MRKSILVLLLVVAPVLAIAGCGGGGGVTEGAGAVGPTDADFTGGYFWQLWAGNPVGPTNTSQWGIVTADGAGTLDSGLVEQNVGGVVSGPAATPALPYTVLPDARIEITVGGGTLAGGIAEDGSLLAVTQVTPGLNPALAILPRGGGAFSDASLSGEYHLCAFYWNVGGELTYWGGTVTFDGAGSALDFSAGVNNGGAIIPPQPPMGFGIYSVGPQGRVIWNNPTAFLSGALGLGGELVVLSGTTQAATDLQMLMILVKKGAGLGNATFSGEYHTLYLAASNAPPPRYGTFVGTSEADGMGNWTVGEGTTNQDGVVALEPAAGGALPYAVAPDGALSIVGGGYLGGVSPSGRCAVFSGTTTGGGSPTLFFLFR